MASFASSSRTILPRLAQNALGSTRGVLHRARPARLPILNSPHTPKEPRPTSGTSHPIDPKKHGQPTPSTSSTNVTLSGEEQAPKMQERRVYSGELEWSEDLVSRMQQLRAEGKSRNEIGKSLNLPADQYRLIPRVAPQTSTQAAEQATEFADRKATWGYNKRLARASREKRRQFW